MAQDIAANAEKRVFKVSKDKSLSSFIGKMLSSNLF